jgi:hypothetical protein
MLQNMIPDMFASLEFRILILVCGPKKINV